MSTAPEMSAVSVSRIADTVPQDELFAAVMDHAHRHDPYPLYTALRREPVSRQSDGTWVVSGYDEIAALIHDPRISSDLTHAGQPKVDDLDDGFILTDPPKHDRIRAAVMDRFTPTAVRSLHGAVVERVGRLIDAIPDPRHVDLVEQVAYPLPVSVICMLLGIPVEDEVRFHGWADAIARHLDNDGAMTAEEAGAVSDANRQLCAYLESLIAARTDDPGDDLISGLIAGSDRTDPLTGDDLVLTMRLLLIAGHETTVNLITNGVLTMLRNPGWFERLRDDPELVVTMVEEIVRFEPSVQFRTRATLADIEIGGQTIPAGSTVVLVLAAGSRDPAHVRRADEFVPDRSPNTHFGFGGGIHYCVGAPLARMEAHVVLAELARRLQNPRLAQDPPPYRQAAALRGPRHLHLDLDGITQASVH